MTTGNFEELPAPAPFRLPADYYSTPPVAVLPRWMPFGCGGLSLFALLIIFAGGAFLSGGGFTMFLDLTLISTTDEIKKVYAGDLTPDEKRAFEEEMKTLRANLKSEKVSPAAIQPLLRALIEAGVDDKASREEIRKLTELARKANSPPRR